MPCGSIRALIMISAATGQTQASFRFRNLCLAALPVLIMTSAATMPGRSSARSPSRLFHIFYEHAQA